jgi:hypothetical protein
MIARELLEELKSVRRNFDWNYCGTDRVIRGKLKAHTNGDTFDPIGAVCYVRTGLVFEANDWLQAAEQIDLSLIDAGDLTAAANNVSPDHAYTRALRQQIIGDLLLPREDAFRSEGVIEYVPGFFRRKVQGGVRP